MRSFCQICTESSASTITLLVTLGRMNLVNYNKAIGYFLRVHIEGHTLHIMGTIVAIAFYVKGL